ncbi:hypothetical protein HZB07_06160 [Candidatus Saganbacteria bacterium]|nr:hypothetical protein [Candidatus Saganbacteria bacterium]
MNNNKPDWEESSYDKFRDLSIKQVLEWMEDTSQFLKHFYTSADIKKMREIKELEKFNVRRTK